MERTAQFGRQQAGARPRDRQYRGAEAGGAASRAHKVARRLKAGTVWINCYVLMDYAMPFGGYKQSGQGREFSNHAIEMYTQLKSVFVRL